MVVSELPLGSEFLVANMKRDLGPFLLIKTRACFLGEVELF